MTLAPAAPDRSGRGPGDTTGFIPQAAPRLRIGRFGAAVAAAVRQVLESDHYGVGPAVARFEPELALYVDGSDPFAIGARLADQARSALAPGGWLLVELGVGSDDRAREALTALDYTDIDVLPDLAGIGRVVVGRTRGA